MKKQYDRTGWQTVLERMKNGNIRVSSAISQFTPAEVMQHLDQLAKIRKRRAKAARKRK